MTDTTGKTALAAISVTAAALAILCSVLVAYVMIAADRREELHDRTIAAEQTAADWQKAYEKLLERVGGSDVPSVPLRVPPKPGNKGSS